MKYPDRPELYTTAYTHGGVFHADDVFAGAFLRILNPDIEIVRLDGNADPHLPVNPEESIVFDVGGGKFDHHTTETMERRPDTISKSGNTIKGAPYASFGKIVREYGPLLMEDPRVQTVFDKTLVIPIDEQDCLGGIPVRGGSRVANQLSMAISCFNLNWTEDRDAASSTHAYENAVEFAQAIILRYIVKAEAIVQSEDVVAAAEAKRHPGQHYIVLDRYVNYAPYLSPTVVWVVYPSMRGGYQMYARVGRDGMNMDLFSASDIEGLKNDPDCTFVHPAGFTACFKTLGHAMDIAAYRSLAYHNKLMKEGGKNDEKE